MQGVSDNVDSLSASTEMGTSGERGFYTREASGLVRDLSMRDSLLLNVAYVNFPLGFLYVTFIGTLFAGANVWLAFLLASLIAIPHLITYGLFSSAMPRAGGDYLFISRSLHPWWGFVVNSTFTLFQVFSTAFVINFVPLFALPALFQSLAIVTGSDTWANLAADVSSQNAQFVIAGVLILLMGVMAMFRVRLLLRAFDVLMIITLLGVLLTIGSLLFIDRAQFAAGFSQFGSVTGVISDAQSQGFTNSAFSLAATFASITLLFGAVGFANISTYFAGEIRRPGKSIMPAIIGAVLVTGIGLAIVSFLAERAFGQEFLNSAQYVADNTDMWPVNASPFINLFIGIASPNTWLVMLLGVGTVAGVWALGVPTFLMATRNIFSHSFDRVLPESLSSVNERTHTPIVATVLVTALMLLFLWGFIYGGDFFATYLSVSQVVAFITFGSVGIAAIIFPFRRKAMYESSPINRTLFGLPLLTVMGVIDAPLMILYLVLLFAYPATGASNAKGLTGLAILAVAMAALWAIAWARLRRRGIDLTLVQEELPPE